MLEKDLFPPLKKYFKELGFKVFVEVPNTYRGVDFVAVKGNKHIAVEMKVNFSWKVIRQAQDNIISFGNSYIAFPVKKVKIFESPKRKINKLDEEKFIYCYNRGIGILEILPHGIIFTALEAKYQKPYRIYDFSQFIENDDDEAGLPYQKGVSAGYYELKAIKRYVIKHPNTNWKEIYNNVQNHYSSPQSLAGSMRQWRGFNLLDFKESLPL